MAHAQVLAAGTQHLPDHLTAQAEPVLVQAARQLDPTQLRRAVGHLLQVADPDGADRERERRHTRRGLWLAPTFDGMVAVDGLLEPEAGQTLLAALEPLARPADAHDTRSGSQRNADALAELARRHLEGGRLPQAGGVRPQLMVTVDLDSLLGHPGAVGGEVGWAGPLDPEACRRLACDGAVTRVLVTRQHPGHHDHGPQELDSHLRTAMALLPPTLGGAPTQPLEVGRTTRVIQPAQRSALAVRDGGCVFPDCQPAPGLVRSPSCAPLAAWRPHRPGQPGPVMPNPSPSGPRGRLATHPPARWPADRHPAAIGDIPPPGDIPASPEPTREVGGHPRALEQPNSEPDNRMGPEHPHDTDPGEHRPEQPNHRARYLHGARARPPSRATACGRTATPVLGVPMWSRDPDPPCQLPAWRPRARTPTHRARRVNGARTSHRPPARRANGPDPPCHSTARGRTPEPRGNPVRTRRGDPRTGGA